MSLAPGPLLRVRSSDLNNNALGVRAGTVPQAVQTPRLEGWRLAVDVTVRVSFAVSMGLRLTVRQGFYHQYKHARFLLVPLRLFGVGPALAGRNQTAQTAVHIGAPCVGAYIETLIRGNEALVGETDFRLVAVGGDFKHNFRVRPLGPVLSEIEVVIQNKPGDFLVAGDKFEQQAVHDYLLGGGNLAPTAVEYLEGLYYVTTGYCTLDYVLRAKVTPRQQFEAAWNDLSWGGKGNAIGQFNTGHGITKVPGKELLDVADRPNSRFERFTRYGHFVSLNPMPSGSLPCDVNYLDHQYSVVPALEGPDKKKGAPIYVLEHEQLVSTVMIKEDLGLDRKSTR